MTSCLVHSVDREVVSLQEPLLDINHEDYRFYKKLTSLFIQSTLTESKVS